MEALDEVHEDDLEPQHSQCDLSKDQVGVAWAVEAALGEDLGPGLEPDGFLESQL